MPRTASNPYDSAFAKMLRIQSQISMLLIASHRTHQDTVTASLLEAQHAIADAMAKWAPPAEEEVTE